MAGGIYKNWQVWPSWSSLRAVNSRKFKFWHVPLPAALPHLGHAGTPKLCNGGRCQSSRLRAARWMPLLCRGVAGTRSNPFVPIPIGKTCSQPDKSLCAVQTAQSRAEFGVRGRTREPAALGACRGRGAEPSSRPGRAPVGTGGDRTERQRAPASHSQTLGRGGKSHAQH